MTSAFASTLDALFADVHLARDVAYTAESGAPVAASTSISMSRSAA